VFSRIEEPVPADHAKDLMTRDLSHCPILSQSEFLSIMNFLNI
jgi:hypothetical protein